jgi:hypothetical protein
MSDFLHCECADSGCPAHLGQSVCMLEWSCVLYRVDMQDGTGTRFCPACADDALASGVFTDES